MTALFLLIRCSLYEIRIEPNHEVLFLKIIGREVFRLDEITGIRWQAFPFFGRMIKVLTVRKEFFVPDCPPFRAWVDEMSRRRPELWVDDPPRS